MPLPASVARIYEAVAELEAQYPGRKFTPDGHLVGSIGEVIAAEAFGLTLLRMSENGHDASDQDERMVQIKLTAGDSVSLRAESDRLLVMRICNHHEAEVVYDGNGVVPWHAAGPLQSNGQRRIALSKLRYLPPDGRIYHVCRRSEWDEAVRAGRYAGSTQDIADGFIHFSGAAQVVASVAKHRAGQDGLVIVEVDGARVGAGLKWEVSRGGASFPHVYGGREIDAATRVAALQLGPHGLHVFPWGLGG